MKILKLFAGSRSFSKAAEELGHETFSVDWDPYDNIDLYIDISKMTIDDVPFIPDIIWSSPDCTTYTIAAISTHRNKTEPKTEYAKECDITNQHFISLINQWLEINPNMVFFIENPRGMLRHMPFMKDFKRHTVWYCFAGDTNIITKNGVFTIKDLCGNEEFILTNNKWVKSKIRNYGTQQIWEISLSRSGKTKTIRTTANHKWFIETKYGKQSIQETKNICKNSYLTSSFLDIENKKYNIINEWVARGFIFGDGYTVKAKEKIRKEKSVAQFCGEKDKDMLPIFEGIGGKRTNAKHTNCMRINSLPKEWKTSSPDINDNKNNIYSWLSGYFTADGTVSKTGQCVMYSGNFEHIRKFETLCTIIGIKTMGVLTYNRLGFGKTPTNIYSLTIIRTDLNSKFFHIKKHKERFEKNSVVKHQPKRWKIKNIKETNQYEDVFCSEVPEYGSFTLEGNILTHNCQYGDDRAKPTDIWTNSTKWVPRPQCRNYRYDKEGNIIDRHCHHHSARRGAKTGTQGRKGSYERSQIPEDLCTEILESHES